MMSRMNHRWIRLPALLVLLGLLAVPWVAVPDVASADATEDAATKKAIKGLKRKLRKLARSKWVDNKHAEIHTILESLAALGGPPAGLAALEGAAVKDSQIRDLAFQIAEENQDKAMLGPLFAMLEDKDLRRDSDIKKRIIHTLQVLADEKSIEPLTALIRYDEDDADVIADAANALAGFADAPIAKRKIAVKKMVDLYEVTYNLMKSVRKEDRIQSKIAAKKYRVYGKSLRASLQSMTGQQFAQPKEWRRWWNDCKKSKNWKKCKSKAHAG